MPFCRRTVEDRLPLERVPLACTFGSPLDLHVRQSLGLQGPVDLDHHRVELLIATPTHPLPRPFHVDNFIRPVGHGADP